MSQTPEPASRNRFLLTNLGILLIFILTLLVLLAAYPVLLAPAPTPTPTITLTPSITPTPTLIPTQTQTPTPTRTLRPTFTATITLTPTQTPTPTLTPTPIGPPTLTPATPIIGNNIYSLQNWSPERAAQLVDLLNDYPNTLPRQERGENDANYYAAFRFAIIAQSEALLRYPDAPQAQAWRWGLAYNLARLSDPTAGEHYAELIAQALNHGEVEIDNLGSWFQSQEPRLSLNVTQLAPVKGFLNSYLIEVGGKGGAFILLLETNSAFQPYVLTSDFDFVRAESLASKISGSPLPEAQAFADDLTGDGSQEIVIYPTYPAQDTVLNPPRIFSLAQIPPRELSLNPSEAIFEVGTAFTNHWSAIQGSEGGMDLQFQDTLFPACPVELTRTYHWSGEWFDLVQTQYKLATNQSNLSYCSYVVDLAAEVWGAGPAIQLMEPILPDWPPDTMINGKPYPADAHDEWVYRLGIYSALLGKYSQAVEYFNQVVNTPSIPASRWIDPAKQFLAAYQNPGDIYRACIQAELCDPRQALKYLVAQLSQDDYSKALADLWQAGVIQRASGYFDFDNDGTTESWFTVRQRPGEKLEFWFLIPYPQGVEAFYIATVETNRPTLTYYNPDDIPPVVILDGSVAFQLNRLPASLQPYLTYPQLPQTYPNRFNDALQAITEALFTGAKPSVVQDDLLNLQDDPGLLCKATWSCDQYDYLLGLASELAGDRSAAVDTYLQLWWDYSKSPFTTMARLKLRGPGEVATATPTLTLTPTPTQMVSPTTTGTPPTETITPTITPTSAEPYPPPFIEDTPTPYP